MLTFNKQIGKKKMIERRAESGERRAESGEEEQKCKTPVVGGPILVKIANSK